MPPSLRKDVQGNMAFSLVGVAILLTAGISMAYIGKVSMESIRASVERQAILSAESALFDVHREVEIRAYFESVRAIEVACNLLNNLSLINPYFQENYSIFMKERFPCTHGRFLISVRDFHAEVVLEERCTEDIVPVVCPGPVVYGDKGERLEEIDTSINGELGELTLHPYFIILGYVNYTLSFGEKDINRTLTFDRSIRSPQAFLRERFDDLQSSCVGEGAELARIVKYILTTTAQYRVLEGKGVGSSDYTAVLGKEDVELAVNLALLLQEARYLRSVDANALEEFEVHSGTHTDKPLNQLLKRYATTGTLDPADIFALYTSLCAAPLNMSIVVSQPIYAAFDQFVGKYSDYLSMPLPDPTEGVKKGMVSFFSKALKQLGIDIHR